MGASDPSAIAANSLRPVLLIILALVGGIAILSKAADEFVEGAARLAVMLNISPIIVGAVLVGFGTSAPEMVVSGIAAAQGDGDLGVGNIIGSNLANLSLILGTAAVLVPISIDSRVLRKEAPLATVAVLVFAVLVQGGISTTEGLVFLGLMAVGLAFLLLGGGDDDTIVSEVEEMTADGDHTIGHETIRTILGLLGTVGGAWMLVWGATSLAEEFGINEGFVGVTLVAVGTSLPELVTVVQSARRQQTDLILGNLLGSNLFNALAVGGLIGILGAPEIDDTSLTIVAAAAAIAAAALATIAMATQRTVTRREGAILIGVYAATVPFLA